MTVSIHQLDPETFRRLVPQLVDIYLVAMNYPRSFRADRIDSWRRQSVDETFRAFAAFDDENRRVVGVAYGRVGTPQQWWYSQVYRNIGAPTMSRDDVPEILRSYFEIAEVHVLPAYQGHGIGRGLLARLIAEIPTPWALLSTPEVPAENNSAFGLYRSMGFVDIFRNFAFAYDHRPFAILGLYLGNASEQ